MCLVGKDAVEGGGAGAASDAEVGGGPLEGKGTKSGADGPIRDSGVIVGLVVQDAGGVDNEFEGSDDVAQGEGPRKGNGITEGTAACHVEAEHSEVREV